jgi:23S rRNA pseudouridine2605 synthase
MRLNKYLAHAGIANRRKADELILQGLVKVDGNLMKEVGYQVKDGEVITYQDKVVQPGRKIYILLNKPKNFSTLIEGEKNLLQLVKSAGEKAGLEYEPKLLSFEELDEETLGLCVITNDTDFCKESALAQNKIKRVLKVFVEEEVSEAQEAQLFEEILAINPGKKIPKFAFPELPDRGVLGIETYSQTHLIKNIFKNMGLTVFKIDIMLLGNITKKDLPRGKWRFLEVKELEFLKG